jgi:hypothetical protein
VRLSSARLRPEQGVRLALARAPLDVALGRDAPAERIVANELEVALLGTETIVGLPGGENDVPQVVEYIRTLIKIGYLQEGNPRILSFEVKPMAGESSEVILANAKRTLRDAWELV